jgi:hypothetical protein
MNQRVIFFRRTIRLCLTVVSYAVLAASLSLTANAQTWTPYATLDTFGMSTFAGPVIDSLGNAWVLIDDGAYLSVVESNGTSGTWQTPYVLGPAIGSAFSAALTVDQSGGVYAVYNDAQSDTPPYPLTWAKYTPATGWSAPAVAYNSPIAFSEVMPAIDSAGHLVVVFNVNAGISSIVYDFATESWGRVQTIVPAQANPILPSMAGNTNGTLLALVYLGLRGLEYSFFDSSTAKWGATAVIPDSSRVTFTSASLDSYFPISVDPFGNVTAVTALTVGLEKFSVAGFHYDGSAWQMTQLGPTSSIRTNLENFGSIAQSPSGAVLAAAPFSTGSQYSILAFRYTPGVGWDTETAGTQSTSIATECRIAWYQGDGAVVAYDNNDVEDVSIYINGAWSGGQPVADNYATPFPGMATAPNGDVVFVMTSAFTGSFGVVATWLEP